MTAELGPRRPWWPLAGAVLLPLLYLPLLHTGFDFVDDGCMVYPEPPQPLGDRVGVVWAKTVGNYHDQGPFRPVAWAWWEVVAEVCQGDAVTYRVVRLAWTLLAAAAFLWLCRELGVPPGASLLAGAIALWNPYRNELWITLTTPEGIAWPFALGALACAVRAHRGPNPWRWDLLGMLACFGALGIKNTFIALIPAQVLLRVAPDGRDLVRGLRAHGWRAALLGLNAAMPVIHFICYKLWPPPLGYTTTAPSLAQLGRMVKAVGGAVAVDYLAPGLLLAALAVGLPGLRGLWDRHRGAVLAGLALLGGGIFVYLPIGSVAPRYTLPAAWGADLILAALLAALAAAAAGWPRRLAYAALGLGLVAAGGANLGRQEKYAARIELMWQAVRLAGETAPPGGCVAWVPGENLIAPEGYHFRWHLQKGAGRRDVALAFWDEPDADARCQVAITGDTLPPGPAWRLERELRRPYWLGRRAFVCYVWRRDPGRAIDGDRPAVTTN